MTVDNDRERQLAAAAWILGWIGGPLPALMMLIVIRGRSWSRPYVEWAAVFWTVAVITFSVLLAWAATDGAGAAVAFVAAVLAALALTVLVALSAARRSRREIED